MEPRPPGRGGVRRRRRLGPGACLLLALSFGGASPSTPAGARGGTPSPPRVAAAGPSCPDHAGSLLPELGDDLVRLVLVRHGMSIWNKDNRFTAWMDVPLSRQGLDDAHRAGMLCRQAGIRFDVAFTSVLQRAIKTCHMILEEIRQLWIPTVCDWRLNERHDGALTGLNKKMAVVMYGDKNVSEWRRSYGVSPPPLNREHPCVPPPRPPPAHARARVARALVPWSTCACEPASTAAGQCPLRGGVRADRLSRFVCFFVCYSLHVCLLVGWLVGLLFSLLYMFVLFVG